MKTDVFSNKYNAYNCDLFNGIFVYGFLQDNGDANEFGELDKFSFIDFINSFNGNKYFHILRI